MSYVQLLEDYKHKVHTKVIRYIKDELKGNPIEFDRMFQVNVDVKGHDESETWVCTGITEEGLLTGRDSIGDDIDFEVRGMDVEVASYILDQLLEVNYKLLEEHDHKR